MKRKKGISPFCNSFMMNNNKCCIETGKISASLRKILRWTITSVVLKRAIAFIYFSLMPWWTITSVVLKRVIDPDIWVRVVKMNNNKCCIETIHCIFAVKPTYLMNNNKCCIETRCSIHFSILTILDEQ